tara:strand:- start:5784 stop:6461 length:678 start_codon:yes stop_codon:yes gene_type:complete
MNIREWNPYLKYQDGELGMAQQTYEPLISPDGKTFCANYNWQNQYQQQEDSRPLYTKDVCDYFFDQEVKYIQLFQNKPYAPEVIDIDYTRKLIFIKWYNNSCNHTIYRDMCLDLRWFQQIRDILVDQYNSGYYKLTMYPHCHYIDNLGNMRAIDWYGVVPVQSPYIEEQYMEAIIHDSARFRLAETGERKHNLINLEIMFKRSLGTHVKWGKSDMSYIYKEIFNA